jgi:hypothetical protein
MAALLWLLIPFLATVAASVWGSWAGRRRTGLPDTAGVAGYERFRAAMERSRTDEPEVGFRRGTSFRPTVSATSGVTDRPSRTAD